MKVKCLNTTQVAEIIHKYYTLDIQNKTKLGSEYGVSARTIGRIVSAGVLKVEWDYCITKSEISITRDSDTRCITKGFINFDKIKQDLVKSDFTEGSLQLAYDTMCMKQVIDTFSEGNLTVNHKDGSIYYGTFEVKNSLVDHIFKLLENRSNVVPMVKFLDKLLSNPDKRIVEQLYPFMRHNSITITENGDILAYRNITKDYKDHHTNTIDNKVGSVVSMPRNLVNCNPEHTCSTGLHVASIDYADSFGGGRLVEVEVCPSNVCSVPVDYDGQKMRTCEFKIIREIFNVQG